MKILSPSEALDKFRSFSAARNYWVMYASYFDGLVTDPAAMLIPVDDHMVHRGDGIFEAARFHGGRVFDLDGHLQRLMKSAELISLKMKWDVSQISELVQAVVEKSPGKDGMLRIFVSRGYGDFSPNPYSTTGTQLIIVSMPFKALPKEKYEHGVSVMFSKVAWKPGFFAQVKSCNYLPNVLAKKESVDAGVDFSIGLNSEGYISEGPTENIMMLSKDAVLIAPPFDYTLRGTTLLQVLELARNMSNELKIKDVVSRPVSDVELTSAAEVMMVGTTLGVLPVSKVDGKTIGTGRGGPVGLKLNDALSKLMGV